VTLKCGLEVTQGLKVSETGTIRKLGCGFLFASDLTICLYPVSVSRQARYWWKNRYFSYILHSTPPLGSPLQNIIAIPFGILKKLECMAIG